MRKGIPVLVTLLAGLTLAGCGAGGFDGVYNMPLPGGADLGSRPYRVKVDFKDVLDLVPQAGVKVNDVPVGKVEQIDVAKDGWTAEVTVAVNGDVSLPANAVARLRQSSLLGEKYVELAKPDQSTPAQGRLADGATIPVDRTNRNPEVEEVFGALSLLLNGGGIAQLQNITRELNSAAEGNEPQLRSLLGNVNTLVSDLDAHRGDITRALDGVNKLAGTLNAQRDKVGNVLDNLAPGLKVLTDQRDQLVSMLQSLQSLSGVAVDTIDRSKADLVADLRALTPTLQKLGEAGKNLPNALQLLLTYPFPDATVDGVKGDYTNLYLDLDLNLGHILDNLSLSRQSPLPNIPGLSGLTGGTTTGNSSNAPALPLPPLQLPGVGTQTAPPGQATQGSGLAGLLGSLLGGGH
ncbi:MCE family protein [Solihabitans fulvus]|uniref:MCE family protein n=1 Tax=Solihabitans fulvus TaxID=1892852 RepID=A0A5B2XPD2_9PSEU|nr:MCE family protein [Solihabitans fulvus]KAA2264751.1 MCE family protein [Solihabitans fulvus]